MTCRIFRVAPEGDLRHLQMVTDQELHREPGLVRQLETVEHALRESEAFLRMVCFTPFANVVEEQGQRQKLRRMDFLQ